MEGLANKAGWGGGCMWGGVDGCRRRSNWKGRLQHNKALILPHTSLLFFEAKSCKIQYASAQALRKPPTARRAAKSEFLPCLEDSWEGSGSTARARRRARKDSQTMAPSECGRFVSRAELTPSTTPSESGNVVALRVCLLLDFPHGLFASCSILEQPVNG